MVVEWCQSLLTLRATPDQLALVRIQARQLLDTLQWQVFLPYFSYALVRSAFPHPVQARHSTERSRPRLELALLSTVTTFGTPPDVAVSELAIESFFPADSETAALLRSSG